MLKNVSPGLIENVKDLKIALNELTIHDLSVYSMVEIYYKVAHKLNEVINELSRFEGVLSNEVIKQNEKLIYLLGEGLEHEVIENIDRLIEHNFFEEIINGKICTDLNNKIDNVSSQLEQKVSKGQIVSNDFNISSDKNKIQLKHLSTEVINTLAKPVECVLKYPGNDFETGADVSGFIDHKNNKGFICNTNLINMENGRKIRVDCNFNNRILIALYKKEMFDSIIDFKEYNGIYLEIPSDITHIRLTIQHYPEDETIFTDNDSVKVYQGNGEIYYNLGDNTVTNEKIAPGSVDNSKLIEPISKLIPWELPKVITKEIKIETKEVELKGIFVTTDNFHKFANIEPATYYINDGEYLVLDIENKVILNEKADTYIKNNSKYILFVNFDGKLYSPIPIYQHELSNIYYSKKSIKGVINVAKSGGDFKTITDALNNANDSVDNPVTIVVNPGVYNESVYVGGNRHISIVGTNKLTCILRDDSGLYNNAPLEIQGSAYISNMTIISTHDNDNITPVDSLRSYAAHVDYDGEGVCEFNNCLLISKQNAAIGSGLHTNQTLKIINCELYSETPNESSMTQNGALFVHDGYNAINQKLIVKNSIIKSLNGCSHYLNGYYGSEMTAHYYNNVFWCDETGKDSIKLDNPINGISNNIKLGLDSFGNNTDILNSK